MPIKSNLADFPYRYLLEQQSLVFAHIGARSGLHNYWRAFEPYLRVIAFEPDQRSQPRKSPNSGVQHIPYGLSNKAGKQRLFLTAKPGDSSFLSPNFPIVSRFPTHDDFRIIAEQIVTVETFDHLTATNQVPAPNFAQLDTQGSELYILQGAKESLRTSLIGLEVEVKFIPLYQSQPLFAEIDTFLRSYNFEIFDLRRYHVKRRHGQFLGGSQGQIVAADAIYLRSAESLATRLNQLPDQVQRQTLLAQALLVCQVYGYFDYALELLTAAKTYLNPDDFIKLAKYLNRHRGNYYRLPNFPGRGTIAKIALKLGRLLTPPNKSGVIRDYLGNSQVDT